MALRRPQSIRSIFRERDREQKQNRKTVRGNSGLESHHRFAVPLPLTREVLTKTAE